MKIFWFVYYVIKDFINWIFGERQFNEYGFTLYVGRQGAGKTMGMVEWLERMRKRYPECLILTNFGYVHQWGAMEGWEDIINVRNGEKGVIFAIDEIQNEYSSNDWKDFPEQILSQITQQRKQRVKIVGTSQVFTRVVKQIREQCFEVVECKTWLGRWTHCHAFDATDYNACFAEPNLKNALPRVWKHSFIQTDEMRELYDSYMVIERMKETKYMTAEEKKLRNII